MRNHEYVDFVKNGGIKMVKVKEDLIGKKFNRLTVIKQIEDYIQPSNGKHFARWLCRCDCGNEVKTSKGELTSGHTKSCGCYNRECTVKRNKESIKHNKYIKRDNYIEGITRKGESFLIDNESLELCKKYTWWLNNSGYIETRIEQKRVFLHRLLTNCPSDMIVDHINRNPLDNRLENLRIVTSSQNVMNSNIRSDNALGIKGVTRKKDCDRYEAHICKDGKDYYLGLFRDLEEAVEARRNAEEKLFGEYAAK